MTAAAWHTTPRPAKIARVITDFATVLSAELQDAAGQRTTLRSHLGPRATVVVFLRHFG